MAGNFRFSFLYDGYFFWMKTTYPILILLLASLNTYGQFSDVFDQGTGNPGNWWKGDRSHFSVNASEQLQLMAPAAGNSILYTTYALPDSLEWGAYFKLDFAPSASNQLRIYLAMDGPDPEKGSGYYLEIGESGSEDMLYFGHVNKGGHQVIQGLGKFDDEIVECRVRCQWRPGGIWELCIDDGILGYWNECIQFEDDGLAPSDSMHFILSCKFSSTRTDKFYFDELYCREPEADTLPPLLVDGNHLNSRTLELIFSEPLDSGPAGAVNNYLLSPGALPPESIELLQGGTVLRLNFTESFSDGIESCLLFHQLTDLNGNELIEGQFCFIFHYTQKPGPWDLIFSEVLADPTPPIGLPESEYLEILNISDKKIDAENLSLQFGSTNYPLSTGLIFPGEYFLLIDERDTAAFNIPGKVIGMKDFPTLPNSSGELKLIDSLNREICRMEYNNSWYDSDHKGDGGWSLELKDPANPCFGDTNWSESVNLIGGTPGRQNSVAQNIEWSYSPELADFFPFEDGRVRIEFDRYISCLDSSGFSLLMDPAIEVENTICDGKDLWIFFRENFSETVKYKLEVGGVLDCMGRGEGDIHVLEFTPPEEILPGDIVINEILFNPVSGGRRYVELVNVTGKYFNARDVRIGEVTGQDVEVYSYGEDFLFVPGTYLVFTEDVGGVANYFEVGSPRWLLESDLPAWDEEEGNITVFNSSGVIVDEFSYTEDMHHPLLDDLNGVALERLSPVLASDSPSNWHSAAEIRGFGTPTAKNSQFVEPDDTSGVFIQNQVFSPNGDGFRDFVLVQFGPEMQGVTVNLRIFDRMGRQVNRLLNNSIIPANFSMQWNGTDSGGSALSAGKYILWIEVLHPEGRLSQYKQVCTLANGGS